MMAESVGILGLGLIGGSIALGLKRKGLCKNVYACTKTNITIQKAKRIGAIDEGFFNKEQLAAESDLLIVATPPELVVPSVKQMAPFLRSGCVVTDTASVKGCIEESLRELEGVMFVGSHPLAGSEQSGIDFARADLFEGRVCVITSGQRKGAEVVEQLWRGLGAEIVYLSAAEHDRIIALTSHLPHIIAFLLCNLAKDYRGKLWAPSLLEMTRVAKSNTRMWTQIFSLNTEKVLQSVNMLKERLEEFASFLQREDWEMVCRILEEAKGERVRKDEGD